MRDTERAQAGVLAARGTAGARKVCGGTLALAPVQCRPGHSSAVLAFRLYSARASSVCVYVLPTPGGPWTEMTSGLRVAGRPLGWRCSQTASVSWLMARSWPTTLWASRQRLVVCRHNSCEDSSAPTGPEAGPVSRTARRAGLSPVRRTCCSGARPRSHKRWAHSGRCLGVSAEGRNARSAGGGAYCGQAGWPAPQPLCQHAAQQTRCSTAACTPNLRAGPSVKQRPCPWLLPPQKGSRP